LEPPGPEGGSEGRISLSDLAASPDISKRGKAAIKMERGLQSASRLELEESRYGTGTAVAAGLEAE